MGTVKDYIQLHFLVILWGFTAIVGIYISVSSVEIVFYRTAIALVALGALLFYKKIPFKIKPSYLLNFLLTGLIIAAHWILFFAAARVSTASVCLAGVATSSFWTSLVEPAFYNRRISLFEVSLGVLVVIGLLIVFKFEVNHALGLGLGVLSALAQAIFATLNSKFSKIANPFVISFYEMIGAMIFTAVFLPFYAYYFPSDKVTFGLTLNDLALIMFLAIVCTVYAFSKSIELMKRISAFAVNLTINLEPVYGMILAYIIIGGKEKMTAGFYLGTLVILSCVISYPLGKHLKRKFFST